MKVIPGGDGWPEAYEYTAGGHSVRFAGEAVEGSADPARAAVPPRQRPLRHEPDRGGGGRDRYPQHGRALEQGAARQLGAAVGALVYTARDGQLTGEQYERLEGELETGFQGARHAGRPLLLEGGLDWKPLSLSPKDMDFVEAKHAAAREIALALGVPPMLLGIPGDNTYSNYQEATRSFWRQTVLPLVNRTTKAFSAWLALPTAAGSSWARPRPGRGAGERARGAVEAARAGELPHGQREARGGRLVAARRRRRAEKRGTSMTAAPKEACTPLHEVKFTALDLKAVDEDGAFEATRACSTRSTSGGRDRARRLPRQPRARGAQGVKLLYQHDPGQPIGVWQSLREDSAGCMPSGGSCARACEVLSLMPAGALDGLSIGFRAVKAKRDARTGIRRLEKVDLWEISVVRSPCCPRRAWRA